MRPLDWPILADENIGPEVITALRRRGKDINTVLELGLRGATDMEILHFAGQQERVVLTHDRDFGRLALLQELPYLGIMFLRPGHIAPSFVLEMLDALDRSELDVAPPFVVVAERREEIVRIRVRSASLDQGRSPDPDPGSSINR